MAPGKNISARHEPFDSTLVLSGSKDERLAKGTPVAGVVAIFVVAVIVRLVHVWQIRRAPFFSMLMGDSRGYDEWALRIARGDWIGHEVFYQAPLYPYLLGVIYAVAGRHLLLVRLVQAVIGSASCVLLALAARRIFARAGLKACATSDHAGLVAGLMLALYAPAIFFDGLLQKSVLDVFFVCLALWLISQTINAETAEHATGRGGSRTAPTRSSSFFWLGLAMGALALTRENAIVLIAVVAVWAAIVHRVRAAAILVLGVAIVLVPVAARNAYVGGGFYVTTSQAGPNFYIGNNPRADGTYQSLRYGRGAPEYERQDATELAEHALGRRLTPAEVSSYWTSQAFDFISAQPAAWLTLMARKVALLWNAAEMVDTEGQDTHAEWSLPLTLLGPVGHFGVLVPLALLGVIVSWPRRSLVAVVVAMLLAYAASVVLFYVFARYRYPLVPFLVLFAAAGVIELPAWFRGLRGDAPRSTPVDSARPEPVEGRAQATRGSTRSLRSGPASSPRAGVRSHGAQLSRGFSTVAAIIGAAIFTNWPILSAGTMRAVTESNLGVALQAERRLDEAIAHYRRAIAFQGDYAPAYNNLGSALRASGRRGDAVTAYQRALELRPEFAGAHYNLANLLLDEGNPAEAADHFQRALRTEPASADVHNNLGIALAGTGRLSEAVAEFRKAIELDSGSAKAHRNLGDALSSAGAQAEAIESLRRSVQLDAADAATRYDLASALLEAGRLEEAIEEFRQTLRVRPEFVEADNNLGIALGSQGKLGEAIEEFRRALQIKPDFADAQRNLAMATQAKKKG